MSAYLNFFGTSVPLGPNPGHGSFTFDGSNDFIELASAPATACPITIALWLNDTGTIGTTALCAMGNSAGSSRVQLDTRATGDDIAAQAVNSGGSTGSALGGAVISGTWMHGAAVFTTDANRDVYLNGSHINNNTTSIALSGFNNISLGSRFSGGSRGAYFGGRLAHVAVWNIALSAGEISTLAGGAKPNTVQNGNLVFYAPLTHGNAIDTVTSTSLTVSGAVTNSDLSPAGT